MNADVREALRRAHIRYRIEGFLHEVYVVDKEDLVIIEAALVDWTVPYNGDMEDEEFIEDVCALYDRHNDDCGMPATATWLRVKDILENSA